MQPTALKDWAKTNDPSGTDLVFKNHFWNQIRFIRDTLPGIVYGMYDRNSEIATQVQSSLLVLSTHTSKSVRLPVFHMTLPDGTECVLRHNFHDWRISVKSPHEITCNFNKLLDPNEKMLRV